MGGKKARGNHCDGEWGGGGRGEGVESLHSVGLCILEQNYTSTARVQSTLTINYNTYKLVQLSKAS